MGPFFLVSVGGISSILFVGWYKLVVAAMFALFHASCCSCLGETVMSDMLLSADIVFRVVVALCILNFGVMCTGQRAALAAMQNMDLRRYCSVRVPTLPVLGKFSGCFFVMLAYSLQTLQCIKVAGTTYGYVPPYLAPKSKQYLCFTKFFYEP